MFKLFLAGINISSHTLFYEQHQPEKGKNQAKARTSLPEVFLGKVFWK